jgi:hypothetical protein
MSRGKKDVIGTMRRPLRMAYPIANDSGLQGSGMMSPSPNGVPAPMMRRRISDNTMRCCLALIR